MTSLVQGLAFAAALTVKVPTSHVPQLSRPAKGAEAIIAVANLAT